MKYNTRQEEWICPMCGKKFREWGNNPWPYDFDGKVVCNKCNRDKIIPARIRRINLGERK